MGSWLDALTTFLFKYPLRAFDRGELVIAPVVPAALLLVAATLIVGLILYRHLGLRTLRVTDRAVLATLRTLVTLLVLACFLRPAMVIASAVPQRNVLAVLFDDSRSMRISDADAAVSASVGSTGVSGSTSRVEAMQAVFSDTGTLMKSLQEKFAIRRFRFSGGASPVLSSAEVQARGTRSDVTRALDDAREDLSGLPLAGVVLVSDGADNAGGSLEDAILALRARRVPVYTVGVGKERFERDLAIERVNAPARTLAGASSVIEVDLRMRGSGKDAVTLNVEADGRVVATESVHPPQKGDLQSVQLRIPPLDPGVHRLAVSVKALPRETVTENNEWQTSLVVRSGPDRVLYIEGEPRPEFAFLRRAVAADSAVEVVGLMRSAERKYLRLGVRDSMELAGGFPTAREDLFKYRAIVLGSVEAGFFTPDQLRMLADFVSVRGGSLLVLGGRASLSEGGYAGTPVADVLPLTLSRSAENAEGPATAVKVHPTRTGDVHPALQLGSSLQSSRTKWDSLPPLTVVNQLGSLRAGATLLLAGRADNGRSDIPVLSFQSYGRGMSAVLGVQDSWLWRMDASMPIDDLTHQTFWRQMVRWLVEDVPAPFEIIASPARVAPGEPVQLRAHVNTALYADVNDAAVTATLTDPAGNQQTLPLEWSLRDDGSYTTRFIPADTGRYSIAAVARRPAGGADSVQMSYGDILVDERGADVSNAELRATLLQRIANETGGKYYSLSEAGRLADDAIYTSAGVTVREVKDLWDMPVVFLLMALLLGTEWAYRRWRGLA